MATLLSLTACGKSARHTIVDQPLPETVPSSAVRIDFWHCLGQAKEANLQSKIVDPFNAKYRGKYRVNLIKLNGDYDSLNDSIKKKLAAGQVPALAMGYPDSFAGYMTKTQTLSSILRLDSWISDTNPVIPATVDPDTGEVITPASEEKVGYSEDELTGENGFVEDYYNEGTGYHFEGTWSMPMYKSTEVMYYNKSYFKGCNPLNVKKFYNSNYPEFQELYDDVNGVAVQDQDHPTFWADLDALEAWCKDETKHPGQTAYTYDVPVTWEEALQLSRTMRQDRLDNRISDIVPFGYDSDANLMISQMAQRNIPYTVNDENSQQNPRDHFKFNNPQAKALATEIAGLVKNKVLATKNSLGGQYTSTKFGAGELLFTVGSSGGSSYNISATFAVGLAQVPYANNNPQYIQQGPSICFFDNAKGQVHKGAWLFYKALADVDNNVDLALDNSYDPVRKKSYETNTYTDWVNFEAHPEYRGVLAHEIPSITSTITEYYMTSPVFIGSGEARNQMGLILKNMYSGANVNDAFEEALSNCWIAVK